MGNGDGEEFPSTTENGNGHGEGDGWTLEAWNNE